MKPSPCTYCAACLVAGAAHAQPADFTIIEPPPGLTYSLTAEAISSDGRVVVGKHGGSNEQGYTWTRQDGFRALPQINPAQSNSWCRALSVSADGSVVGGIGGNLGRTPLPRPIIWEGGVVTSLTTPYGYLEDGVLAISADGSRRAGRINASAFFQRSGEAPVLLGMGTASGISADGTLAVGWLRTVNGDRAVRWSESLAPEFLPTINGLYCRAAAVSPDGQTIVGSAMTTTTSGGACRWTSAGIEPLGTGGSALGVSAGGLVIVGQASSAAFIWDAAHGIRDLRHVLLSDFNLGPALQGWSLWDAVGISADGRVIVGNARTQTVSRPFVATLGYVCYANCDQSTATPSLTAADFQCFINRFAASDPYANCDRSITPPVLNANDFMCFLDAHAAGCP